MVNRFHNRLPQHRLPQHRLPQQLGWKYTFAVDSLRKFFNFNRNRSLRPALLSLITFLWVLLLNSGIPNFSTAQPTSDNPAWQALQPGIELFEAGRYYEATQTWQDASERLIDQNDRLYQALTLTYLSFAWQELEQWDAADKAISEGLALLADQTKLEGKYRQVSARLLLSRAQLQLALGQAQTALATLEESYRLYGEEDAEGQFINQINQVQALSLLGYFRAALKHLEELEQKVPSELCRDPNCIEIQAPYKLRLGNTYQDLGDMGKAWKILQEGVELTASFPNLQGEFLLNLGSIAHVMGQQELSQRSLIIPSLREEDLMRFLGSLWDCRDENCLFKPLEGSPTNFLQGDRGLWFYANAIKFYEAAIEQSSSPQFKLKAQLNILEVLLGTAKFLDQCSISISDSSVQSKKIEKLAQAQALWIEIRNEFNQLQSYNPSPSRFPLEVRIKLASLGLDLARYQDHANYQDLKQILEQTISEAGKLQDQRLKSYAVGYLGQIYFAEENFEQAQQLTQKALDLSRSIQASDVSYQWEWELGKILISLNDRPGAIKAYGKAINSLQNARQNLIAINFGIKDIIPDFQFYFHKKVEPVYRQLIDLLLTSESGQAVSQDSLLKALTLYELLERAEIETFLNCNLLLKDQSLLSLTDVQNSLASKTSLKQIQGSDSNKTYLDKQIDAVEKKLQELHQLDPSAALIFPIIFDDRIDVIASLPNQPLLQFSSKVDRQTTEEAIRSVREILANYEDYSDLEETVLQPRAAALYQWFLQDLEPKLQENQIQTLAFMPDSSLRNIPFSVLYNPKTENYIIKDYAIAIVLTVLDTDLQKSQPKNAAVLAAALGDKSPDNTNLSALPSTAVEVETITQIINRSKVLIGETFTWESLRRAFHEQNFPILHIATHGEFNSSVRNTFLIDAQGSSLRLNDFDEFLDPNQLDLLVLSACETAEGSDRASLGLAGVAIRSGAKTTVATLFLVIDDLTAKIMPQFYREFYFQGIPKAQALRDAQLAIMAEAKPSDWSPYVIVGDWL
jgi:CHAT domain-containing protein/predicted negative regulator of RcsB-dependent stress response